MATRRPPAPTFDDRWGPVGTAPTLTHDGEPPPVEPAGDEDFGRFHLGNELGRGGVGRVVEAVDAALDRTVALKILLDYPTSPGRLQRFASEARVTAQLQHPNIVPVHDTGANAEGRPFIVMRRVEGRSLREILTDLARGAPDVAAYWTHRRLLDAFVQAGRAVAYAHDRGVIHRDLKPDNIMLGSFGEVQVMDWGLARTMGAAPEPQGGPVPTPVFSGNTEHGATLGTPGYMSPEQVRGEHEVLDARSDVWSLGAILYELLALRRAYVGADHRAILAATLAGPPPTPTARSADRPVPEELSAVCMRAMATSPRDRYPTAQALVGAVEDWLHGSQRRALAAERLSEGESHWDSFRTLSEEKEQIVAAERALAERLPPWATGPAKLELLALRDRSEQLDVEVSVAFARVIAMGERALSFDPGNPDARAFLARAYWHRVEEAEAAQNTGGLAYYEQRVREYDDGFYAAQLDADATLSLRSQPGGAEVVVREVIRRGLVWSLGEPVALGRTPLVQRRLAPGSYVLTISQAGYRDTVYPVFLRRGQHWQAGAVALYADEVIGPDFVYVPGGPCLIGGDPEASRRLDAARVHIDGFFIARYPVRAREWAEFLTDLARIDPDEAVRRAPRQHVGLDKDGTPYWPTPAPGEPWVVPATDADGDPCDPELPVCGVSWDDARAYAAWRSKRDGLPYDLPRERQWEKAARGVDGRLFPWGDRFDPTLAKVENSRAGRPQPEPVGAFPTDCSVYGVHDLGGGAREWCGDPDFDGDPRRRPVRGGCWVGGPRLARAANRFGFEPKVVHGYIGLRLVRRLPLEPSR